MQPVRTRIQSRRLCFFRVFNEVADPGTQLRLPYPRRNRVAPDGLNKVKAVASWLTEKISSMDSKVKP